MITKLCAFISFISFACHVSGHGIYRTAEQGYSSELDKSMIYQTGCKFLSLSEGESKMFMQSDLSHVSMGSPSGGARTVGAHDVFQMNFAIRADKHVELLLFTKNQYLNYSQSDADYRIKIGVNGNDFTISERVELSDHDTNGDRDVAYIQRYTPEILSPEKYVNFYFKIDDSVFRFGKKCNPIPIYFEDTVDFDEFMDIVQIGFVSKSNSGAKILYDCPANFAGCKCT